MSGGHFDYKQFYLRDMADSIEQSLTGRELDDIDISELTHDYNRGWIEKEYLDYCREHKRTPPDAYAEEIKKEFKRAYVLLRLAETYVQRIDWLLCGDDGEDTFHRRLTEELKSLTGELADSKLELMDTLLHLLPISVRKEILTHHMSKKVDDKEANELRQWAEIVTQKNEEIDALKHELEQAKSKADIFRLPLPEGENPDQCDRFEFWYTIQGQPYYYGACDRRANSLAEGLFSLLTVIKSFEQSIAHQSDVLRCKGHEAWLKLV